MAAAIGSDRHRRSQPQPVCALVRTARLRLRSPQHRSRGRIRDPTPRPGYRTRDRKPLERVKPLAGSLCRLEAKYGDPLAALDYFTVAIRNYTIRATPPRSVSPVDVNVDSQNWTETRPSGAYY